MWKKSFLLPPLDGFFSSFLSFRLHTSTYLWASFSVSPHFSPFCNVPFSPSDYVLVLCHTTHRFPSLSSPLSCLLQHCRSWCSCFAGHIYGGDEVCSLAHLLNQQPGDSLGLSNLDSCLSFSYWCLNTQRRWARELKGEVESHMLRSVCYTQQHLKQDLSFEKSLTNCLCHWPGLRVPRTKFKNPGQFQPKEDI